MNTIIFDLDGTTLNTIFDLHTSVNYMLNELFLPKRTIEEVTSFVGNGIRKLIERSINIDSDELIDRGYQIFMDYYRAHLDDFTVPYPDIIELFNELKARGYKIGILSNKFDSGVKELIKNHFGNLVDASLGVKDNNIRKPSPSMVYNILDALGSNEAILVGDSIVDAQTAINAHIPFVLVSWGYAKRSDLEKFNVPIIDEPLDLLDII